MNSASLLHRVQGGPHVYRIAPNLQLLMQVRHFVHLSKSILATVFFSQMTAPDGQFL